MRACVADVSPVVGSSSTTTVGSAASESRDTHPLLLTARELVREAPCGTRGC